MLSHRPRSAAGERGASTLRPPCLACFRLPAAAAAALVLPWAASSSLNMERGLPRPPAHGHVSARSTPAAGGRSRLSAAGAAPTAPQPAPAPRPLQVAPRRGSTASRGTGQSPGRPFLSRGAALTPLPQPQPGVPAFQCPAGQPERSRAHGLSGSPGLLEQLSVLVGLFSHWPSQARGVLS